MCFSLLSSAEHPRKVKQKYASGFVRRALDNQIVSFASHIRNKLTCISVSLRVYTNRMCEFFSVRLIEVSSVQFTDCMSNENLDRHGVLKKGRRYSGKKSIAFRVSLHRWDECRTGAR